MGSENSALFGNEVRPLTGSRTSVKKGWRRPLVNVVLLMWAEALNESGARAKAIEKVNEVRKRAGGALLNSNATTMVGGQQDLRERIRNERRIEYPGEGINYFDELRWKTWTEKVFFPGNGKKQIWSGNVSDYSYKGDFLYTWPVPTGEIQMNPNLVQNPGWMD